jgi:predicted metal-binding membrane protein
MATRLSAAPDTLIDVTRRRTSAGWPWLVVAGAWTLAIAATLTGQRYLVDHHFLLTESGLPWPVAAVVFLACWQVMLAAMMLPSSMSTVAEVLAASRAHAHAHRAGAAFLAGYAGMWTVFALLAFTGDTAIHRSVDAWPWLGAHVYLIGATTLAAAGTFQFSPLKQRCLAVCHEPRAFVARCYQPGPGSAWGPVRHRDPFGICLRLRAERGPGAKRRMGRLGARHGLYSVGCCWGLMLIMFGIGVGGLGWMAALTVVMMIEDTLPGGQRIRRVLGVALLLLAVLWVAQPGWLAPAGVS